MYPIRDGVLTYYVYHRSHAMPSDIIIQNKTFQNDLFTLFDLPPETRNVKIDVKNKMLARYQIAPITLEAEVTFTIWQTAPKMYDVFYCGMYELGPNADKSIKELKSPPELPPDA